MIMVEFDRPNNNTHRTPAAHYHGSPHLQHLDRPSAHSTPSPPYQYAALPHIAAQQQQQQQQQPPQPMRQTPTSYPSPAAYPSPSMQAYPYPPQQAPQAGAPRGSPYAQPTSINLPPIRLNPPAQLPPPQHEGSPPLGSQLPQNSMHSAYYGLPPPAHVPHPHITSSPMRYPLPSATNPERIMSGGRHKKEIKRRTKTGCLTCRKRRIKCDEGHPTCKNCQKSKRDCLGYDPIFKAQPGPAAIQPAPTGGSTPLPAMNAPFNSYTYAMPVVGQSYSQPLSTAGSSPTSSCETYDYPQIDPALDAATSHPHLVAPMLDPHAGYRPDLKRPLEMDRTSSYSPASDAARTPYTPIPRSSTPTLARQPDLQGPKRIKIDDLLSVGSTSGSLQPLSPPSSELAINAPSSTTLDCLKSIYNTRYAPAVDSFLELGWFSAGGSRKIYSDNQLAEVMAEAFERFKARGGAYCEEEDPAIQKGGKETDLMWASVRLCYGTRIPVADNRRDEVERTDGEEDEASEALGRIRIVETILTRRSEYNPASPRLTPSDKPSTAGRGGQFWYLLEKIAGFQATGQDSDKGAHRLLEECRQHLEGKGNRELLHAIAELHHHHGEADTARRDVLRKYIHTIATDRSQPISSLDRRIAGRAMGLWTDPVTEVAFCMPT